MLTLGQTLRECMYFCVGDTCWVAQIAWSPLGLHMRV